MDDKTYNLIINSENIKKERITDARNKMGELFQLKDVQLDKIFSGKFIRFIKNINYDSAQHFQNAIKEIGFVCQIEDVSVKQEKSSLDSKQAKNKLSLESEKEEMTKSYYCPMCKVLQENHNECEHCYFNLEVYRKTMKKNNFIEVKGKGYIAERRKNHRRNNTIVRREEIRMGEYSDRRANSERRKDMGAWG